MNTNKFSFSRFASFFRWFAAVGTKTTIKITAGLMIGTLVIVSVVSWNNPINNNSIYEAIFLVTAGIIASMALSDVNENGTRQQFLSIPATNLEKYLAVLSISIVRTMLALIALCIADVIRAVIDLKSNDFYMVITNFSDTIVNPHNYLSILLIYWWLNYLLGIGIRKYTFIYGCIIGWSIVSGIIKMISAVLYNNQEIMTEKDLFIDAPPLWGILIMVGIIVSISYVIFFRSIKLHTQFYQYQSSDNNW